MIAGSILHNHLIPIKTIQNLDSVINLIYRELYLNLE